MALTRPPAHSPTHLPCPPINPVVLPQVSVVNEICAYLDIPCLTIRKKAAPAKSPVKSPAKAAAQKGE